MAQLLLENYYSFLHLDKECTPILTYLYPKEEMVEELLHYLIKEDTGLGLEAIPSDYKGKRSLLRALLNERAPKPFDGRLLNKLDILLQRELQERGTIEIEQLELVSTLVPQSLFSNRNQYILWQGDITQLKVDAIVNAANNGMLGCFQPLHACIDNAIHSAAGPQLREDCARIMSSQGEVEQTGTLEVLLMVFFFLNMNKRMSQ